MTGSHGEHEIQAMLGSTERASRFYKTQHLDRLNERMVAFIGKAQMMCIATADLHGECDCSFRAGPVGFVEVTTPVTLRWRELRGNGVYSSLGNIWENPHIGLWFPDFTHELIGLHVNGSASVIREQDGEPWVSVWIKEAFIHCRKHLPRMVPVFARRDWGTDDTAKKGGDYFNTGRNGENDNSDSR